MSGIGHNAATPEQLKIFVNAIIELENQKKPIVDEIKDTYKEAKDCGFPPKALRAIVKRYMEDANAKTKRDADEAEQERLFKMMGPLGAFAVRQAA